MEEGWSGRSMVVGARATAGTPCVERGPVNLRLGGAESERGCTVKALVGFLGSGMGVGAGSAESRCSGSAEEVQA